MKLTMKKCIIIVSIAVVVVAGAFYLYKIYKGVGGTLPSKDEVVQTTLREDEDGIDYLAYIDFKNYDDQLRLRFYYQDVPYREYIKSNFGDEDTYKHKMLRTILIENHDCSADAVDSHIDNILQRVGDACD